MDGRQALAKAFDDWYAQSGLNQSQVAAAGGPSTTTQTKVRQSDDPVSRQTLQQVDHVTGWPPGTALRYLSGAPIATMAAAVRLEDVSDDALLDEVRRRMKGDIDAGISAKKSPERGAGEIELPEVAHGATGYEALPPIQRGTSPRSPQDSPAKPRRR